MKGLPRTNTLAYFALSSVMMVKCLPLCQQERQGQLFVTDDKSKISYGVCPWQALQAGPKMSYQKSFSKPNTLAYFAMSVMK
jgi:hypothetical protein